MRNPGVVVGPVDGADTGLRLHDPAVPARALFWSIIAKHLGPGGADGFESDFVAVLLDGLRAR